MTPRRRGSSAFVPHRVGPFAPAALLPDVGLVGYGIPWTLLIIALVITPAMGGPMWLPRLDPGEAVWLPRGADLYLHRDAIYIPGAGIRPGGEAIDAWLREVARRDDDLGLVLAAPSDVPYARVLDVMEAAQAVGVRRVYLMADVRRQPRPAPSAEEPSP